jgi:signal transduction histidine kinase
MSLFLVDRIALAASGGVGQAPWAMAVFVLPFLYAVPSTRRWMDRCRWPVLSVQVVLTWVPFAIFGSRWPVGLGGLLAGMVLLMVRGRAAWLVAGFLAGADILVRATVTGLWPVTGWSTALTAFIVYLDNALYLFGVVRLAQIVDEVKQAHRQAAALTAARERLRAAQVLQATVGERLAAIAATAEAARQALARDVAEARTQIAAAGTAARETVGTWALIPALRRGEAAARR